MALKATYEIRCGCGTTFAGDICEYVFAEHDPELKDSILSGGFNRIPCPSCGRGLHLETKFLYRDEKNKLWVWVGKRGDEPRKDALAEELIEKNASMEFHFLEDRESYRKFLVFGREGLLELLLKEDPTLKRREGRRLKTNPAFRLISEGNEDPGYLFLSGEKIRISLPLKLSRAGEIRLASSEEKRRWLQYYSQGVNIHNPFSSFLNNRASRKWKRIREKESADGAGNEFDDFAEAWAAYRMNARRFASLYPERREFFDSVRKMNVSRKLRSLNVQPTP